MAYAKEGFKVITPMSFRTPCPQIVDLSCANDRKSKKQNVNPHENILATCHNYVQTCVESKKIRLFIISRRELINTFLCFNYSYNFFKSETLFFLLIVKCLFSLEREGSMTALQTQISVIQPTRKSLTRNRS